MREIIERRPGLDSAYTLRNENSEEFRWVEIVPIDDWPEYGAGEDGRIYRLRDRSGRPTKPRALLPWVGSSGYGQIYLARDGRRQVELVHRLVAKVWLPNPLNLPEVGHNDENKLNCEVTNLTWQTRAENISHSANKFRTAIDKRETWTDCKLEILILRDEGLTISKISQQLKRSMRYVSQVCNTPTVKKDRKLNQGETA